MYGPERWVTERPGDMGYTFAFSRGQEGYAMEGEFCYGRTNALCYSVSRTEKAWLHFAENLGYLERLDTRY